MTPPTFMKHEIRFIYLFVCKLSRPIHLTWNGIM